MFRRFLMTAARAVHTYRKQILYYAGVAAVLCAVAACAEAYRTKPKASEAADAVTAAPRPTVEAPSAAFAMPEDAELLRRFARRPVWNETLSMYEVHEGVDLAFADGVVKSVSDGTVVSVDGGAVMIAAGAYTVAYRSIVPDAAIRAGDPVNIGDVIGSAANTDRTEAWMPPHAHLEVSEAGRSLDPENLPVKNLSQNSTLD